ncbi:MAG: choice-of-anchor tandem repeat GloVer-containing protein [Bryobacteraceae bacterium]|jgi:uncharacterized repeat protein (TIGR03803 family)
MRLSTASPIRSLVLCFIATIPASAQTFTTLVSFDVTNGAGPAAALVQGTDGNFYGMTGGGGANSAGTVFKMTPSGALTTLYNFCSQAGCTDGISLPLLGAGLVQGSDGNFYGTTQEGGSNHGCGNPSCGTVFKITSGGALTTLYSFCAQSNCADGSYPNGLVQGTDGNFYGTTEQSGAYNNGTIFKITPSGTLTTLYTFCSQGGAGCTDGADPSSALVEGSDDNFYGTTWAGGTSNVGTVFKITAAGALTTLHSFDVTDGDYPSGALVQGSDGNFYGTTARSGTVFKMTPAGVLTTLATFGGFPYAGLIQGTDGNFYGATAAGGENGKGSAFEITPAGTLTTLYNFCIQTNCSDGAGPLAAVVEGVDGNLYGTTVGGGAYNAGTVFKLAVGLPLRTSFQSTLADIARSRQLGLITNQLAANALTGVIDAAQAAPMRGRKLILEGFIQLVDLLARGKLVTGTAPQILVNDANSLIVQNP